MNFEESLVVKIKGKWHIGYVKDLVFYSSVVIKKLSDVKGISDYIPFRKYLKNSGKDLNLEIILKESIEADSIYILDKPVFPLSEDFEKDWWMDINDLCKDCDKSCKQSSKAIIVKCDKTCGN